MARPAKFTENAVEASRLFVKEAETARDLRIGLSILIPKIFGVSNANAAEVLGVGKATVVRMQKEIRDRVAGKSKPKAPWGGRRRGHLSFEQEKEFIDMLKFYPAFLCHLRSIITQVLKLEFYAPA